MCHRGDVVFVPRQLSLASDPEDRRHVLLHPCSADETAWVAYGTRQDTQARYGAPCVVVFPGDGNGFADRTFVFPGLVVPLDQHLLTPREGSVHQVDQDAMSALAPAALGLGSGARGGADDPGGSRRGAIVRFSDELRQHLSDMSAGATVEHGILLSPHHLSRNHWGYQTVVPVLPSFDPGHPDELDVKVHAGTRWISVIKPTAKSVLVLVPDMFYTPTRHLTKVTSQTVDDTTLGQIETIIAARLAR